MDYDEALQVYVSDGDESVFVGWVTSVKAEEIQGKSFVRVHLKSKTKYEGVFDVTYRNFTVDKLDIMRAGRRLPRHPNVPSYAAEYLDPYLDRITYSWPTLLLSMDQYQDIFDDSVFEPYDSGPPDIGLRLDSTWSSADWSTLPTVPLMTTASKISTIRGSEITGAWIDEDLPALLPEDELARKLDVAISRKMEKAVYGDAYTSTAAAIGADASESALTAEKLRALMDSMPYIKTDKSLLPDYTMIMSGHRFGKTEAMKSAVDETTKSGGCKVVKWEPLVKMSGS